MRIGFLPLYVKLYDDISRSFRTRLEAFYETLACEFEKKGVEVVRADDFCRLKPEFISAVSKFENADVDAIVTLHMAYSPSLECIDALSDTKLPIIVLDTTDTLEFPNVGGGGENIMYCHGIHGVMDMCSMFTQRGVTYTIAAGHWQESDVLDRVCGYVRAARAANALKQAKVGLVGGSFAGMGDFRVAYGELNDRFGIKVLQPSGAEMSALFDAVTDAEIEAEKAINKELYDFDANINEEEYSRNVRSCLAMRKYIAEKELTAFSVNFLKMGSTAGLPSTPFLEACKAMENGIGYAGEGDVMTAAFTGALLQGYEETSFVEIFCPDWKNNTLLLSHMGEVNYRIADCKPMIKRKGATYVDDAEYPYAGYTRMKGGKGCYVNISRARDDYRLFIAPADMVSFDNDDYTDDMRGWMKPEGYTTAEFLEEHSKWGATHHSIFVYGATADEIEFFARLLDVETVIL